MHRVVSPVTHPNASIAADLLTALAQGASSDAVSRLVAEDRELREQNARLHAENESRRARIAALEIQIAWLSKQLFGVKRERLPASSLQVVLGATILSPSRDEAPSVPDSLPPAVQAPEPITASELGPPSPPDDIRKRRTPHGRGQLPEHLPVETIEISPEDVPHGARYIGEEVSYRLAYRKSGYTRLRVVRKKFAQDNDDASVSVHIEPVPDEMIPRALPDPAMLAHTIHSKWGDQIPYTRLSKIIARQGVRVPVSTLSAWEKLSEPVARIVVDAAWEDALVKSHVMGIDATGVRVVDTPHDRRAHIWVLLADRAQVFFRYSAHHTSDMPKSWLEGYEGIVVADASSVYDDLFRSPSAPKQAGCMSHCRRKYFFAMPTDARARPFVELADALFAVERDVARLSPDERLAVRHERSAPLVEIFARARDSLLDDPTVDPRGPLSRALRYSHNHWEALTRFLQNGRIPLSNNDVYAVRGINIVMPRPGLCRVGASCVARSGAARTATFTDAA